jgi:hypothetical protein
LLAAYRTGDRIAWTEQAVSRRPRRDRNCPIRQYRDKSVQLMPDRS